MLTDPQLDLNKAYSIVSQDEQQRDMETPKEPATDLIAQAPYKPPRSQGERPYCGGCKRLGNTINTCYQLHRYPTERPAYRNQQSFRQISQRAPNQYNQPRRPSRPPMQ